MEKVGCTVMAIRSKGILMAFLFSFMCVAVFAQAPQKEKSSSMTEALCENLQKIDLKTLELCVPSELKSVPVKCRDNGCYRFESQDMVLDVDLDKAAGIPVLQRTYPTYHQKSASIDGEKALVWVYEDKGIYKYACGVNFNLRDDGNYNPGIYLFSKSKDVDDICEKIFTSVKFKRKSGR
jgi:hypothetical protein